MARFVKGQGPWNKGLKGIHLSPETEFKKGHESNRKLPIGAVTIRHRKREKSPRAWVKVAEPNVWRERAKISYEASHGPIPRGFVVHHIDRDPLNDSPENLEAMSRADHMKEHRDEIWRTNASG